MTKKTSGLGRGLSALLGEAPTHNRGDEELAGESAGRGIRDIEIGLIRPNPHQPRKHFSDEALADLAASIADRGVLQPILVRQRGDHFELIAGERRWRAAQRARLHRIPALVRDASEEGSAEIALIENVQRENLSAIEEADAYARLIADHGHSQEVVSKLVGKSRSHVANLLRLRDLPSEVQHMLLRGDISMGHARALVGNENAIGLANEILEKGLSVRQIEERARVGKGKERTPRASPQSATGAIDADLAALERQLGDMLGLRVQIRHGRDGGSVQLAYSTLDQLDLICQRLSGEPI